MKELKPKYFLYARKSTEDDDHQIMSIEAQLFELHEYARRENLEILQEFQESKSAKKPGRELFNKMMTLIETSKVPLGILAWHPDRLARNSVDGGKVVYLVDTEQIVSLRFPTFWFEPTPQGKFMLQVAFGQSKYYSDNLVENITRGIRQKVRRGEWLTLAPFGYANNPKTRNIESHPTKSRIVVRAFEEYAKGTHTLSSIANFLADHGVTSKGTPPAKSAVAKMLRNRVYLGFTCHKGEYYDGSFEPIISPTLFEAVQKMLAKKSRPVKRKEVNHFPFAQFARCGECGSMITAQYATNRFGTTYTYYRYTKKKGVCHQPYLSASALTTQIHSLLQKVSLPLSEIENMEKQIDLWEKESISERGSVVQNLKTKLLETKEKLDKLVSVYLDGDIEREIYLQRKDLLLRQKAKIEESFKDFGQQRKNWVEPLRSFVLSLREAIILEQGDNYLAWKEFFQKIDSNPILKDKTLSSNWAELFDFTAQAKADFLPPRPPSPAPTAGSTSLYTNV
ncbi:MAG: recombinase family protein, partial [Candidatus Paceibacterota bacterium]